MSRTVAEASRSGAQRTLPWIALLLGFSPVLLDLGRHLAATPEASYVLLAPLLLGLAARRELPEVPRSDGYFLLALGLALELLGIAAASWSVARLGLPLGIVGLARARGFPPLRSALLGFFLVPVPTSLVALPSPELESALAAFAGAVVRGVGGEVRPVGPLFTGTQGRLELSAFDAGIPLAATLAALGWYSAVRRGARVSGALASAVRTSLWAVLIQPCAIAVAVGLFALGLPTLARSGLSYAPWLCATAFVLVRTERRA